MGISFRIKFDIICWCIAQLDVSDKKTLRVAR